MSSKFAHADLLKRIHALMPRTQAVMLYGSHARGTARGDSDIDVLALVDENPGHYVQRELTVAAYVPDHLRSLAERGSLFVLHLIHDGVVVEDRDGALAQVLERYEPPADPHRLTQEMEVVAAGLLAATPEELEEFGTEIQGLATYVLRTAVYNACVLAGSPEFDLTRALERTGLPGLEQIFRQRRTVQGPSATQAALDAVAMMFPRASSCLATGLVAAAVLHASDWPVASDLLASVLVGHQIDYTALTLPVL